MNDGSLGTDGSQIEIALLLSSPASVLATIFVSRFLNKYSQADEVLVDLGDVPKDDKILVDCLERLACIDEDRWRHLRSVASQYKNIELHPES